jgi:hypothetical protein
MKLFKYIYLNELILDQYLIFNLYFWLNNKANIINYHKLILFKCIHLLLNHLSMLHQYLFKIIKIYN